MKIDDPRVTDYALGEMPAAAREAFEKELGQSSELQRELEDTVLFCQQLNTLPSTKEGFDEKRREELRTECLRNLRVLEREGSFRRAAVFGAVGALAACLLAAFLIPWTAIVQRSPAPEARDEATEHAVAVAPPPPVSTPAPTHLEEALSQMIALAEPMPPPTVLQANEQDPNRSRATPTASSAAAVSGPHPYLAGGGRGLGKGSAAMPRGQLKASFAVVKEQNSIDLRDEHFNTEAYDAIEENKFRAAKENPLSTFSIDVDTASYSNVRRFLQSDALPPSGAVRIEELINYFSYAYPEPK
ncbi:MAG TPA: von Willebrand factor type A domain-containing protein, partial [Terrimicrobiaceae bacterium]